MISIHKNTIIDLELNTLLEQVAQYAKTELGKQLVLRITPIKTKSDLFKELNKVNEYLSSFDNENRIPAHAFREITEEIKLLGIDNSFLEIKSFQKIASLSRKANGLIKFFLKFKIYYPELYNWSQKIELNNSIIKLINEKINRYGEIKDEASPELTRLRKAISTVKSKIDSSFALALAACSKNDFLDDIKESVVENRRVLAVKAMYRKKVKGVIMGSSKTGSIAYIEPKATSRLQSELNNLEFEHGNEIVKVLKELTNQIRENSSLLVEYQNFLTHLDSIYAKAQYALSINAILPKVSNTNHIYLKDAYHPLLLVSNNQLETYPQTIELSHDNRIIVISGPNAGGKSITLKTIGLIQLMFQCGLLVPVHEDSVLCVFKKIICDIGDNQSIENHLSTYSYRLKQMKYFLKKCDAHTLFLIDEFGTGSDPELGGALAEAFLEVFYERNSFGVITTHYANLKLLANELPAMQNANMMFNARSLQPIYKLILGEAGSSFTFEVAQKNGIPYNLINRAKKKIEGGKVRFDKTIAKLQNERSKLERTTRSLRINDLKKQKETDQLEIINARMQHKLESYQELYDRNQRLIYLGRKVDALAAHYKDSKNKNKLLSGLYKLAQIENAKRKTLSPEQKRFSKKKEQQLKIEVEKRIGEIRKEKLKKKQKLPLKIVKEQAVLHVGDMVRLENGRATGTIVKIEKNNAIVNYGIFTTHVGLDKLELVKAK